MPTFLFSFLTTVSTNLIAVLYGRSLSCGNGVVTLRDGDDDVNVATYTNERANGMTLTSLKHRNVRLIISKLGQKLAQCRL